LSHAVNGHSLNTAQRFRPVTQNLMRRSLHH